MSIWSKTGVGILCLGMALPALSAPGATNWTFTTGAAVLSSAAIGTDGTLYFGSYDETFYAVKANGTLDWSFSLGSIRLDEYVSVFSSPAIGADGTVYFGTEDTTGFGVMATGTLYAMNPATGRPKWSKSFTAMPWAALYSDPAVGEDGTVYIGCSDSNLYAINPTGTEKWRFKAGNLIYSEAVLSADGMIYFGCDDGKLYALNSSGQKQWDFQGGQGFTASPALGSDGAIYFGSTYGAGGRTLYAINPDGTKRWGFLAGGQIQSSAAIGPDDTIYFGCDDGKLYALYPNGTKKWEFTTGGPVQSSPAIGSDGVIYFGSDDFNVYAVDSAGNLVWSAPTGGRVYASPVLKEDGTVYVGSYDGKLYALQGSSGLMVSAWPMFRNNIRHTAVSDYTPPVEIRITSISVSGGMVSLTWTAEAGKTYGIQSRPFLVTGSWSDLPDDVTAAGDTASWTGTIGMAQQTYYQIVER